MAKFDGWKVVAAGSGLQFLNAGLLGQSFGAYVAVLSAEKGWSKTALSGAAAMQSVETAIIGPLLGWMIDRLGPARLIRLGVVVFGLGLISMGLIDSLAGFYAAVVTIAVGTSLCGYFPINVAIIHWFERKRARALASVSMGLALGGVIVPVVASSMVMFGWRATAIGSGLVIIVAGWPLARMIHGRPADVGQTVDGLPPTAPAETVGGESASAGPEFTAREALRTRAFWLLSAGHGLALLIVSTVNVHAISHMKESLGYTVAQASLVITLMTLSQIGGVLTGMTFGDRFNKRMVAAACMVGHGLGMLMLTYATGPAMLAGFAVLHGVAWGLRGPLMQAIRADYFGRRSIGMILGLSTVVVAVGQVTGPMVAGTLADATGTYRLGFTLLALVAVAGSALFAIARPPELPRPAFGDAESPNAVASAAVRTASRGASPRPNREHHMSRRAFAGMALLAAAAFSLPLTAAAQAYPSKGIRIIVPFPAGGPTDQVARMVAQKLQDQYGQSVIVDNRPGGGGQIGMAQIQQSPADGYTLIIGDMGLFAINTTLYTKLSYDVQKELVPITLAMSAPMVLTVPATSPDNSVADLVRRSKSGATINFASQGIGTGGHLIGEMLHVESGGKFNHVPYKGSAPAMQDLIAGQVDMFFEVLGASVPQAKAGKIKMLALAAPQRSKLAPDLPTTAEVGFPKITMTPWFGFAARTGTPEPILRKLQADIVAALNSADIVTKLQTVGFDPIPGTPEQMAKVIRDETERWGAVVKSSGAKVE